jgi:hypothetical protein
MKSSLSTRVYGQGLLGSFLLLMHLAKRSSRARSLTTFGFGVILAGFSAAPAQALVANSGTDYLLTPTGGAKFVFDPPPAGEGDTFVMPYSGLPILTTPSNGAPNGGFSGLADTVVNRKESVTASPAGVTEIEVVGLSLFAKNVSLPSPFGGPYDTVAGLQKYYGNTAGGGPTSVGTMTIRGDLAGNPTTWDSIFTVKAIAFFSAPGTLGLPTNPYAHPATHLPDLVRNIIGGIITARPVDTSMPYACQSGFIIGQCLLFDKTFLASNEPWQTTPIPGQLLGDNLVIEPPNLTPLNQNFFISDQVQHDAGDGTIHTVDPAIVPGPLPILGLGASFSFSRRLRKKCRTAAKSA